MVAAISRLASLLKQATAGDVPLPVAKPDPAKAALIKTLVTPRAPPVPMPSLAPPLVVSTRIVATQKEVSSQVMEAYRAAFDLEETGPGPTSQRSLAARGTGADAEITPRSLSGQPAGRDETLSGIRVQPMSTFALTLPLSAASRQTQEDEAAAGKRRPAWEKATYERPGGTARETVISGRVLAFGLAAFAVLLLIVLLVF